MKNSACCCRSWNKPHTVWNNICRCCPKLCSIYDFLRCDFTIIMAMNCTQFVAPIMFGNLEILVKFLLVSDVYSRSRCKLASQKCPLLLVWFCLSGCNVLHVSPISQWNVPLAGRALGWCVLSRPKQVINLYICVWRSGGCLKSPLCSLTELISMFFKMYSLCSIHFFKSPNNTG